MKCPHCDELQLRHTNIVQYDALCYDYTTHYIIDEYKCGSCGGKAEVRESKTSLIPTPVLNRKLL